MINILITGADGFIGSHLCNKLLKNKKYFIVLVDRNNPNKLKNISYLIKKYKQRTKYFQIDIVKDDLQSLEKYKFKYIYHLASIVGVSKVNNPLDVSRIIIDGTKKIINLSIFSKSKLLLASTSEIYGKNPNIPWYEDSDRIYGPVQELRWSYAHSKALSEQFLLFLQKKGKIDCVIVRYFNVYGPSQSTNFVVPKNIVSALKHGRLTINESGNQTRSFTFIDDAIEGTVKACESTKSSGEIFNLSYPKETSIFELMNIIQKSSNKSSKIFYKKSSSLAYYYDLIPRRTPDVSNAKNILNWEAKVNLEKGIKRTFAWYKKNIKFF